MTTTDNPEFECSGHMLQGSSLKGASTRNSKLCTCTAVLTYNFSEIKKHG